jgi:hypothetical protein
MLPVTPALAGPPATQYFVSAPPALSFVPAPPAPAFLPGLPPAIPSIANASTSLSTSPHVPAVPSPHQRLKRFVQLVISQHQQRFL